MGKYFSLVYSIFQIPDGGWRASPYIRQDGRYSKGNHFHYTQETKPTEEVVSYLEGAKKMPEWGISGCTSGYEEGAGTYKSEMTQYKPENLKDAWIIEPGRGNDKKLDLNKLSQPDLIKRLNEIKYPDGFVPEFSQGYVHKYTKKITQCWEKEMFMFMR